MFVFDQVSITVRDLAHAKPFYEALMAALGVEEPPALRAFLVDPEGNRGEAVDHRGGVKPASPGMQTPPGQPWLPHPRQ